MLTIAACPGDDEGSSDDAASADGTNSGNATNGGNDTGGDLGDGVTDCSSQGFGEVVCQAGQYCEDSVLSICTNGCLSNDNCTSEQTCEKGAGEDVGSCQNVGPGGPSLEEFCMKLLTCDMSGTMDQCTTVYNATNEGCHQCIVDGNCGDVNGGSCDMACGI